MGTLRIILAFAVIFHHVPDTNMFWFRGPVAVLIFFMISGFYMSLIYTTKYSLHKNGKTLFYSNRALRLYPVYFLALFLVILISLLGGEALNVNISEFLKFPDFFLLLSNLVLFGADYQAHSTRVFLAISPAWSLGSEVLFYLMVPFIVTRPFVVIILLAASLYIRSFFIANGYSEAPFLYNFFPSILAFFLMGNLGFYIYNKVKDYEISRYIGLGCAIIFLLFVTYNIHKNGYLTISVSIFHTSVGNFAYISFFIFALSMPFLFLLTKDSKIDRFLGNLSYSLYIFHLMIIDQCKFLIPLLGKGSVSHSAVIIVAAILFSICVYFLIEKPIDAIRKNRVDNAL